jgi:hypothetical protein
MTRPESCSIRNPHSVVALLIELETRNIPIVVVVWVLSRYVAAVFFLVNGKKIHYLQEYEVTTTCVCEISRGCLAGKIFRFGRGL